MERERLITCRRECKNEDFPALEQVQEVEPAEGEKKYIARLAYNGCEFSNGEKADAEKLSTMVENFSSPVPLLVQHSWDIRDKVGRVTNLYLDGDDLKAEVEIFDDDIKEKVDSHQWEDLSLTYSTPDYKVIEVSIVAIPAVEGARFVENSLVNPSITEMKEKLSVVENELKRKESEYEIVCNDLAKIKEDFVTCQNSLAVSEENLRSTQAAYKSYKDEVEKKELHRENEKFISSLLQAGKITPASKEQWVTVLNGAPDDQREVIKNSLSSLPVFNFVSGEAKEALSKPAKKSDLKDLYLSYKSKMK